MEERLKETAEGDDKTPESKLVQGPSRTVGYQELGWTKVSVSCFCRKPQ